MYYITFLFGALLSILNRRKGLSTIIFAIVLLLLASFRYGFGSDYFAYSYLFNRLNTSFISEITMGLDNQEIGFRLVGVFFKSLGLSYQVSLVFFSMINIYFVYKTAKEFSKNPTLSMFIYYSFYFFVWTISGIRQGLTLTIGIYYLLKTIQDNKVFRLFVVAIVLSLFHTTALVLIPLYYFSKLNLDRSKFIILLAYGLLVSILPFGLILEPFLQLPLISRIAPYLGDSYSFFSILDFQSLARLLFISIGLFYYKAYTSQDHLSKSIMNIYLLSLILFFFLRFSELTAARLTIYGRYLDIIILANIYYLYKDKINKLIYIIGISTLLSLYLFKEINDVVVEAGFVNEKNSFFIPYTNIINKDQYEFESRYLSR